MALVVLLRGVNVGGHRTLRPTALAEKLRHLEPVNIGAAGTFVIRRPVSRAVLHAEIARWLPFETDILIFPGREIVRLVSGDPFKSEPGRRDIVQFVSFLARRPRSTPTLPLNLPPSGTWLLQVLARDNRLVLGHYRRQMKAVACLGTLDRIFGVPVTTRNWNTVTAIARVLAERR